PRTPYAPLTVRASDLRLDLVPEMLTHGVTEALLAQAPSEVPVVIDVDVSDARMACGDQVRGGFVGPLNFVRDDFGDNRVRPSTKDRKSTRLNSSHVSI